jgi:cell division protein FtsL
MISGSPQNSRRLAVERAIQETKIRQARIDQQIADRSRYSHLLKLAQAAGVPNADELSLRELYIAVTA